MVNTHYRWEQDLFWHVHKHYPRMEGEFSQGTRSFTWFRLTEYLLFQKAVATLSVRPSSPKFGLIDCEQEKILCHSWVVGPPSLYYFTIPNALPHQAQPPIEVKFSVLNRTASVSTIYGNITDLIMKNKIEDVRSYDGLFHPFNGFMSTTGLSVPMAYVVWAFALMPSWLPMILISLFSRTLM